MNILKAEHKKTNQVSFSSFEESNTSNNNTTNANEDMNTLNMDKLNTKERNKNHQNHDSENKGELKEIECFIKWFNYEEGYGFIKTVELDKEIFIHISVLLPLQIKRPMPGDTLICSTVQGVLGPQVDIVHSYTQQQIDIDQYHLGFIKWFNPGSDFGFISGIQETGERDIFIPGKRARANGIDTKLLRTDQKVYFTFKQDLKNNFVINRIRLED